LFYSFKYLYLFAGDCVLQIADAVVVARYIGATLVLPDIRGNKPGDERFAACHFHDNHLLFFCNEHKKIKLLALFLPLDLFEMIRMVNS
jgi:hypothetical protein